MPPKIVLIRNKHGCLAPEGCKLPRDQLHPQVAFGDEIAGPYEATFRVGPGDLERLLSDIVQHSWTLKAWFAYKITVKGLRDKCDVEPRLPTWERVSDLIRRSRSRWESMYQARKQERTLTTQWEIEEPQSTLQLFAFALTVLARNIKSRSASTAPGVRRLTWHDYYYENEGKLFVLYHFMQYQHRLFGPNRPQSIHRPNSPAKVAKWESSYGYKIHQAAESFVEDVGWEPLAMLSASLRSDTAVSRNPSSTNKSVTFIHTHENSLRVYKRRSASIRGQHGSGLHKTLRGLLNVSSKSVLKSDCNNSPIEGYETLLEVIDASDDPVVWLRDDSGPTSIPAPMKEETPPQQDYSNHAILKLEQFVRHLPNKDHARSARARFSLLRENNPHSVDFIKDLKGYFAPLEQATTSEWHKLTERKRLCEDAMGDPTHFDKLRELIAELGAEQQAHAQQYFALVNTSNPLASLAAENLNKLLMPDDVDWLYVKARKNVFDEINSET